MLFNKWQPVRPRLHPETGEVMAYRTMPKKGGYRLRPVCSRPSQIAQMRLYRAACQGHVGKQVAISDLYEYCFYDIRKLISKTQMGYVAVDTTIYEPRLLVNNRTVGKATMTYTFQTDLDFKYGLEWMLCTWLWKFLNQTAAPDSLIGTSEQMLEELEMLGGSDDTTYREVYEEPLRDFEMAEPDWETVCKGLSEQLPEPEQMQRFVQPPPPRRLDELLKRQ